MRIFLSLIAILFSFLSIFAYGWVTFLPRLGMATLYHLRRIRWTIAVICLAIAAILYWQQPSSAQLAVLLVVVALTPLSGFTHASRILVSLDSPSYRPASQAQLSDAAQVLGYAQDEGAYAWPLELLIPHHIVNDQIAGQPVMAAW
jgi:hypothetical protein